ncbi:glycosyltransferase [Paracoccus sp. S1E-3]|uniref:glycosyltransferase n=1 Tax=Paracoccus sp. S1E-3 TaxID=2756130 RepID=UPI0015EF85BC|nr:glycosyltransferase [Paracoccus sp. S1E-3]MBA4492188.1 glycosyltransferase [Paracoccus sp. S1E-3]
MTARQKILTVLGMHRSGTSFLTDCIEVLGFTLPADRSGPSSDNPKGHFEPQAVVQLNDDLMRRRGGWWGRIAPITVNADPEAMAAALADSFGDAPRVVIKDPRISLLMPAWRPFLEERGQLSALIALRHPGEIATSLSRRDAMGTDMAYLSWMAYTLAALEGSEGLPRGLVLFPDWIDDIDSTLERIAQITDVPVPSGAVEDVTARFQRDAVHGGQQRAAPTAEIDLLAGDLFTVLARHAREGSMPDDAEIAPFRARFDIVSEAAREVEAAAGERIVEQVDIINELNDRLERFRNDAARFADDGRQLQEQVAAIEQERSTIVAALESQISATERQRDEIHTQLTGQMDDMRQERETMAAILQQRIAATEAQRNEIADTLGKQVQQAHAALAEVQQRAEQAESQRDAAIVENSRIDIQLAQTEADLETSRMHLDEAKREQTAQIGHLTQLLELERMTILKPLYRRVHRMGGDLLRGVLSQSAFDWLKRAVPHPGNVPTYLAYAPRVPQHGEMHAFDDVAPADPAKPDIFVLSIINWDFRTQRPQHLASEMARAGHRVFFIEMETSDGPAEAREVAPNVYVLRLSQRGMGFVKPYSGDVPVASQRAWVDHFYNFADRIGVTPRAHVVIEHPYWWNFARHLAPQFQLTFDCMDEIAGFSNTEQAILDAEEDMIAKADHMIVSSQYLHDKYAPKRPVRLVRNGTDVSHFVRDEEADRIPDFLAGKLRDGAIRVGYVGAIAEWFDTDLLEEVARQNPDFDIHLCGAVTAEHPARLNKLPNVTMHGEILYADVPAFLKAMDVLIIPFQLVPIIQACDPVKFYEYSAVKKPTVSTALPELARAGDLVTTANDPAGFAQGIRDAAAKSADPMVGAALRAYALENAWSYRAADMLAEMESAPLLSVVVLAYGSADLTLACLHSLLGRGEVYPALEVLVVDNGSPVEELEKLREVAEGDRRIRLIENGENLGFAKGNNVGIEAARGEYLLLLNNDTYVPPGALSAMVRHLQLNPEIGIIGPMTNNIGNEARIEVHYADMAGMESIARDLVTGYRGIWTPIPVNAYFCAMFRKADMDRIGHLPTVYGRGMFEDDDHCAMFREAGMDIALAEDAFVHHHLSATFNAIPSAEKQALFEKNKATYEDRWGPWVPHRYRDSRPDSTLPDKP